ncbi:MAG: transposase family protein [Chloroflexi bacterium]|nr:transposase family protein [Chloroflexota bacterium]
MTLTMDDSKMQTLGDLARFVRGATRVKFKAIAHRERYAWISATLAKFKYWLLRKKDKSTMKAYMRRMTGFSDAQMTRLIARRIAQGRLIRSQGRRNSFSRRYTASDVALLADTDNLHQRLSGPATKRLFERAYAVYGDARFERLKDISVAHLYNLRATPQYARRSLILAKTRSVKVDIGLRKKPRAQGRPGFLRVDTVHQGDRDKAKGVYHINVVDEITQWEIVGAVEGISEAFLLPMLEELLALFPFEVRGFHSDNGSEYINDRVALMLNKLLVEQTKSRANRTNDNALVEGKNGSVIRKQMGYWHIPSRYAAQVNAFYRAHLDEYLNFHRPCGFATKIVDKRGKVRKVYKNWQTPYERLQVLPKWRRYLRPGVDAQLLESIASRRSDNEHARLMQLAKNKLFATFKLPPAGA